MPDLWESFPPDVLLKSVLVQGGAFRMPYEFGTEREPGEKQRYFFVVSKDPAHSDPILVLTSTTRVEGRKRARRDPRTLVEIDPGVYPESTLPSIVDCNSPFPLSRTLLERRIKEKRFRPLKPLPAQLLHKVLSAVARSRLIAPAGKRLILPDEFLGDMG